jgi:hypothetical protein
MVGAGPAAAASAAARDGDLDKYLGMRVGFGWVLRC